MAWFVTVPISGVISAAIMAVFKYIILWEWGCVWWKFRSMFGTTWHISCSFEEWLQCSRRLTKESLSRLGAVGGKLYMCSNCFRAKYDLSQNYLCKIARFPLIPLEVPFPSGLWIPVYISLLFCIRLLFHYVLMLSLKITWFLFFFFKQPSRAIWQSVLCFVGFTSFCPNMHRDLTRNTITQASLVVLEK